MWHKRLASQQLTQWKDAHQRRPLLVRGARQVGKTALVEQWGTENFSHVVSINFERQPQLAQAFTQLDAGTVLEQLSLLTGRSIVDGSTLLFLDEVQNCPRAIMALRYLFEERPALHVIAAGSLLEFALQAEDFSMPVGRIESLYLAPMSFREFLMALGEDPLVAQLDRCTLAAPMSAAAHERLLELLARYFIVGGMPAVVETYVATRDLARCQELQTSVLTTYRHDFGKYAKQIQHKYLEAVFHAVPAQVGKKLVYHAIDDHMRSRDLKPAVWLLSDAGVLHRVHQTSGAGLPFAAHAKEQYYKLLALDIGLMHSQSGLGGQLITGPQLLDVYGGALAEQFVGQELLALSTREPPHLYYWAREARSSQAEIDFLWAAQGHIVPIEVKAGSTGRLRSLHHFMDIYHSPLGIRISPQPLRRDEQILSIPLYLTDQIARLVAESSTGV